MTAVSRIVSRLALLGLALFASGCAKACKNDRPYVPYSVGDATSSADGGAAAAAAAGPEKEPPPVTTPALVAPLRATSWRVAEGLDLTAPPGRELALALVHDVDGDGAPDALAVTKPAGTPGSGTVDLVLVRGSQPGKRIADATPTLVASGPVLRPECSPVARLERVGPRSAFAELGMTCTRGGSSRTSAVVRLAAQPTVTFQVTIVDPPSAAKLSLDVDGADRDKDGIDDVYVRVTLEGASAPFEPAPHVTGKLVFFDRPAGASRDPDEPEGSLRALAQLAGARARGKDAATVPVLVQQARALYRAICEEGGAPRLTKRNGGGAISCGASGALEDAGVAEVRAAVASGDALRAFAAAASAQAAPAKRTAQRTSEIQQLLNQVAPVLSARASRMISPSVPLESTRARHPEWGPLAFDAAGHVLVRGGGHVVSVDPTTGEEQPSEVGTWPSQVLSPDGHSRWLEVYHACEGVALRATFAPTGAEGDIRDVVLPIAPPLGSRCAGTRSDPVPGIPLAWGPRGLEAIVSGQLVLFKDGDATATILASAVDQGGPPGSPRAPGGGTVALATPFGVLVRGPGPKAVRVSATELEASTELRHCVATDDGTRVACVRSGKLAVAVVDC